ncbi:MAG: DUF423 domain-containing protein [Pseudomonadota bacterium]
MAKISRPWHGATMTPEEPKPLSTFYLILAGISGLMSVGMAALGSHALEGKLQPGGDTLIEQASLFQLAHAICLIALFFTYASAPVILARTLRLSAAGFAFGLLLFCLPIYWLGINGPGSLGPFSILTPIGGVGFLIGWAGLSFAGLRYATAQR